MLIPNGQRSGIISGIIVSEIEDARNQITVEVYHRIMISEHKTGYLQSATIFIYADVFLELYKFVRQILPRIPAFEQQTKSFTTSSNVFITFNGNPITSSNVTPLLRRSLKSIGLNFKGTVTDFRRAAATLTGQINPQLSEKMALFLGHSRRVHDRHYRIQLGHFGLAEVFTELGMMQSNPYSCNISSESQPSVLASRNSPYSTNSSFANAINANKSLSGVDIIDKVTLNNRVIELANNGINRVEDDMNNSFNSLSIHSVEENDIPCIEDDSNSFIVSETLCDILVEKNNRCFSINEVVHDETRSVGVVPDETSTFEDSLMIHALLSLIKRVLLK